MWRKIHSDRDPRDTLFSELKKEFGPRLMTTHARLSALLAANPRLVFFLMVSLLFISAGLSFTVFRHPEKAAVPTITMARPDPVGDGFGRILGTTRRLKETLQLRQTVDSLAGLRSLTAGDSLLLDSALDRLRQDQSN